jgi:GNAT superfamily N-acetyltransferase
MKVTEFKECSPDVQGKMLELLWVEWEKEFTESGVVSIDKLSSKIVDMYAFFVFTDKANDIIGSVGVTIDTPRPTFNTQYWIGNLLVNPVYRNQKQGKMILEFIENYLWKRGITVAHLWCNADIIEFYKKYQWNFSEMKDGKAIMIKML